MELTADFRITPAEGERAGAYARFPYDRELVRRFRKAFPRARWRDEGCWFVPGVRAARRLDVWMAGELAAIDRHADAKGRDDFAFDPLASAYLEAGDDLVVRTPWSRTVVAEMRAIPWARWDPLARVWRVPYRSVAELRRRWPAIETAAQRNEPEARLARAMARDPDPLAKARQGDRRRRRYPVPVDDLPPLGAPVGTLFGLVVFEGSDGECPSADEVEPYPFAAGAPDRFVWARVRLPDYRELRALAAADAGDASRGWWAATGDDIDAARERLARGFRRRREKAVPR
jgi:hypothetical protein